MYLVREVFKTKPGKAKELVKKFKDAMPYFEKDGGNKFRVMTDATGDYWTVVFESEVDDLGKFFGTLRSAADPELASIMKGYTELVYGGHREIFVVE